LFSPFITFTQQIIFKISPTIHSVIEMIFKESSRIHHDVCNLWWWWKRKERRVEERAPYSCPP
jgi:hypothetical protein